MAESIWDPWTWQAGIPAAPVDERPSTRYRDAVQRLCDALQDMAPSPGTLLDSIHQWVMIWCIPSFDVESDCRYQQERVAAWAVDKLRSFRYECPEVLVMARDMVLLACARGTPVAELETKKITGALLQRLCWAFDRRIDDGDEVLWSTLSHSKYKLFTPDMHLVSHGRRRGRNHRPDVTPEPAEEPAGECQIAESDNENAASPPSPAVGCQAFDKQQALQQQESLPWNTQQLVLIGETVVAPIGFEAEPEPEEASRPKVGRAQSVCKDFKPAAWKQLSFDARSISEVVAKAVADIELRYEVVAVDKCTRSVMAALCEALPHWKEYVVCVQWLHFFRDPRHLDQHIPQPENLRDILKAACCIALHVPAGNIHGVRHCCVGIGGIARACPELARDVAATLVEIVNKYSGIDENSFIIQGVCMKQLGWVCWTAGIVMGVCTTQVSSNTFPDDLMQSMLKAADDVVDRCRGRENEVVIYSLMKRAWRVRVYLRREIPLGELEACLEESVSLLDGWGFLRVRCREVETWKEHHRRVLLQFPKLELQDGTVVKKWMCDGTLSSAARQQRMVFAGTVFGGDFLVQVLSEEWWYSKDEAVVTDCLRAVMDVNALAGIDDTNAWILRQIAFQVDRFRTKTLHSAYVKFLSVFADFGPVHGISLGALAKEVVRCASYWLDYHYTDALVHEALWALNGLAQRSDGGWHQAVPSTIKKCMEHFALTVLSDVRFHDPWDDEDVDTCQAHNSSDAAGANREAQNLIQRLKAAW